MPEVSQSAPHGDGPTLVIEPSKGWVRLGLRELWQYRELLYFLTWKNILIRYKQAVLGVLWAVLNPVITMVVFTVIFNKILGVSSGSYGVPYAVFTFTGLLPWNLFSGSLSSAGNSLVGNSNLITKVYFPRLVIPSSAVMGTLPDFLIGFVVLAVLMASYQIAPTWNVVFLRSWFFLRWSQRWASPMAQRLVRSLPGCAVHHPVAGAAVVLPHAGHLPDERDSDRLAQRPLQSQSYDGSRRRLSLGTPRPTGARNSMFWLSAAMSPGCLRGRSLLFQAHGTRLRGRGMSTAIASPGLRSAT